MKKEYNISESTSEYRLWWRKEGFNLDDSILVHRLDGTLCEAGLARLSGTVLYE